VSEPKKVYLTIRVSGSDRAIVQKAAKRRRVSLSGLVRQALVAYVPELAEAGDE
jgi:predicted HicB family RNase H-like nuclease